MEGTAFRITYDETGLVEQVSRGKGLDGLYAATDCSMVEVAGYGVLNGVRVALLCDEEGLAKPGNALNLTACDLLAEITNAAPLYLLGGGIVGTCSLVSDEDLRGFTDEEVTKVRAALDKGGYPIAFAMEREG